MEQRAKGTLRIWAEPFTKLRVPKIFNLRMDLMKLRMLPPTRTTIGCLIAPTCWCQHKRMLVDS